MASKDRQVSIYDALELGVHARTSATDWLAVYGGGGRILGVRETLRTELARVAGLAHSGRDTDAVQLFVQCLRHTQL